METIKVAYLLSDNLGDAVFLSCLLKQRETPVKLFLKKNQLGEQLRGLYEKHCEVEYCEGLSELRAREPDVVEYSEAVKYFGTKSLHMSRLLLNFFDLENVKNQPVIHVDDSLISWAKNFCLGFKDPIVIIPSNCGSGDTGNALGQYRKPPLDFLQRIVDENKAEHDFIQFGVAPNHYRDGYSNFHPLKGSLKILDLPLNKLAALYKIIGKMISGDTGDYHFMVAVGGKANVLVPNDSFGYEYSYLHYNEGSWDDGASRVDYINFSKIGAEEGLHKSIVNF